MCSQRTVKGGLFAVWEAKKRKQKHHPQNKRTVYEQEYPFTNGTFWLLVREMGPSVRERDLFAYGTQHIVRMGHFTQRIELTDFLPPPPPLSPLYPLPTRSQNDVDHMPRYQSLLYSYLATYFHRFIPI